MKAEVGFWRLQPRDSGSRIRISCTFDAEPPIVLKCFVNGAEEEAFYQKRKPADRSSWLRTVTLSFPSGRTAEEIVVDDAAVPAWIVNLGCIERSK